MSDADFNLMINILREKIYESLNDTEITFKTRLKEDLFIDSISFYSLLVSLEQSFNVTFDIVSIDAKEFKTVESIAIYIDSLKSLNKISK